MNESKDPDTALGGLIPPRRGCLADLSPGAPLPDDAIYIGRSAGPRSKPMGWGNPFRDCGGTPASRREAVSQYEKFLWSNHGRWHLWRLHELTGQTLYCHCQSHQECHADVLIKVWLELAAAASRDPEAVPPLNGLSLVEAGYVLRAFVGFTPGERGDSFRGLIFRCCGFERGAQALRDLLPLPLSYEPAEAVVQVSVAAGRGARLSDDMLVDAGVSVWLDLVIWALNWVYGGRRGGALSSPMPRARGDALGLAQRAALDQLEAYIRDFLGGDAIPVKDWGSELQKVKLDYSGEEVHMPEAVTWAQLEPALPPMGTAARVRALDLAEGWLRERLLDPKKCLLDEMDWPVEPAKARVWVASDSEWVRICRGAAERGLFAFLQEEDVFHAGGRPVFNGLFGVPKKGKLVPGTDLPVLRMIINAIPSNEFQELLAGDIRSLPYFGQWSGIQVDDADRVLVWTERDMTAAFYLFRLEDAWLPYQAIGKPVRARDVGDWCKGMAPDTWVYPAVTVMMMGWKSACGLLQHFHRKLCFAPSPIGAGLDPAREVRRDAPLPGATSSGGQSWFSVYLDGFSQAEITHWTNLAKLTGDSPETRALQDVWAAWGVPRQEAKELTRVTEVEALGCRIDGIKGLIMPPRSVLANLLGLTAWLAEGPPRSEKALQIVAGRWVRCFQFRREASCLFRDVWEWMHPEERRRSGQRLPPGVVDDFVLAMAVAPLLVFDLRARVSPLVVASDASEQGMGVCRTSSLTGEGLRALDARRSAGAGGGDKVGLIEMFNGVGAARRALELCGVRPAVYAAVHSDGGARAVIQAAWAEAVVLAEPGEMNPRMVEKLVAQGPHVTVWIVTCALPSSPSNGASAPREDGEGVFAVARARLLAVPQVAGMFSRAVRDAKVVVMGDAASQLGGSAEQMISHGFAVRPLEVCPSGRAPVSDKRLYWISWKVSAGCGVRAVPMADRDVLEFEPPEQHTKDSSWAARRYPNADGREVLLGFEKGHTKTVMNTAAVKTAPTALEDRRYELLGKSASARVMAFLLGELLYGEGVLGSPPGVTILDIRTPGSDLNIEKSGTGTDLNIEKSGIDMVRELIRRQAHTGRDLRRVGPLDDPGRLPRAAVRPAWWKWRRVFGAPWTDASEHINVLELRAFLASLAWRLRAAANVHSRGVHLLDSQVVLGALAKGRSASRRLGPLLARANALQLAASLSVILGYVRTEENPADAPSRSAGG